MTRRKRVGGVSYRDVHALLHRLWTRAVRTEDYDRSEWQKLEQLLGDLWEAATGEKPHMPSGG